MTRGTLRVACVICACAMGTAARAQPSRAVDIGVAYSFLRTTERSSLNMSSGWLVSLAFRATNVISVVGEVAGNYKTVSVPLGADVLRIEGRIHTFQAGVRLLARQSPKVTPWGQFLLGRTDYGRLGEWSIEPGVGVDVPVGGRVALRVGVGFPMTIDLEEDYITNFVRFQVGFVF